MFPVCRFHYHHQMQIKKTRELDFAREILERTPLVWALDEGKF
jgi:hypothetical protein